jgi:hypothetical protein
MRLNNLIMTSLLILSSTAFAAATIDDMKLCNEVKDYSRELAEEYITEDLSCTDKSECSEVNYIGGSRCGARMVNQVGQAGYQTMLASSDYQLMEEIIASLPNDACGPIAMCDQRPEGQVMCVSSKCKFVMD